MSFTHLHVHSEYSLLDGLARVEDLVGVARARGFESLAITDHGALYGAVKFVQEARKQGVKPIVGCELYVAARGRRDRDPERDRRRYHLTVLAADDRGYRNLLQLASAAQLEGYYYKPRVDRELLELHSDGLVVLSGCQAAEAPRRILDGQLDAARESLAWYRDVFGDRFFAEVQSHGLAESDEVRRGIVPLAREMGIPLVATNDVHYARSEDVGAHEVLLCIQTSTNINDPKRMRYGTTFYLRTEEEMRAEFAGLEEAVDNTARVAEMCSFQLDFEGYRLPRFDVPAGETAAGHLRRLCEDGLSVRYPDVTPEVRERLDYELRTIHQMGFDDYFLIVWDLCRYARQQGIWWNVRGSGAGSIVAYLLRITNLDPLAHGLLFERFLNPSRVSMPDIDLDFPDDQRDDLIRYTFHRYGSDHVAQIISFGTMGPRAAIRDAGRALDLPLPDVDRVARLMPAIPGKPCSIDEALLGGGEDDAGEFYTPDLAKLYREDDGVRRLLDTARQLEGVARHASTHAAGVVISDRPLVEYVPLHRPTHDSSTREALPVTQFDMNDIETLGLLKIDFLGLSTLTVLRRATELVEIYHGVQIALDDIPLDDPVIYEALSSGNVTGVFQVESAGMRRMLREMQPQRFEHVVAAIALYRPGPMEQIPHYIARLHGRERIEYRHPRLEPILAETYGIIVYQEQIMQIARDLAGYAPGEADMIRKAVGKKNKEALLRHRQQFLDGAIGGGMPRHTAEGIFDDIEFFARYGFNKSHAADYAVIVCQTAWLKARYPVEYAAALLSVDRDDTARVALVAADCRRAGIEVLPPSLNRSDLDFTIETRGDEGQRDIRFGLAAIKNVGEAAVRILLDARGALPFADLEDLARRADLRHVGKRALESLIRAGALDDFGPRAALLLVLDRLLAISATHHQAAEVGQLTLFGGAESPPETGLLYPLPAAERDLRAELAAEKDLIGLYVSEHPLKQLESELADSVTVMIGDIDASMAGEQVALAGMVTAVRRLTTRKGAAMAYVGLADLQGEIELIVFPSTYERTRELWAEDRLVVVRGRVELRDDRLQILADAADAYDPGAPVPEAEPGEEPEAAPAASLGPGYHVWVTIPRSDDHDRDVALLAEVYATLTRYEGRDGFSLLVANGAGMVELEFPNNTTRHCVGLIRALEALVGEGNVQSVARTPSSPVGGRPPRG